MPLEEDKRKRKKLRWVGVSQESEPLLGWKRYSSLAELRRVLAYVMGFVSNTGVKKQLRQTVSLTATELRAAQSHLVKRAQVESFGEEMRCLENGQEVHKRSRIKSLDPRMEGGFLVVGGRLQKTQALPYKTQHPKIIDSHHELAQLIIEDMHRTYHHPPTEHLLNLITVNPLLSPSSQISPLPLISPPLFRGRKLISSLCLLSPPSNYSSLINDRLY